MLDDDGEVPHPAGSLAAVVAAVVYVGVELDDVADVLAPVASRLRNAAISVPDVTMPTTSQPSADFSVSFVARPAAS